MQLLWSMLPVTVRAILLGVHTALSKRPLLAQGVFACLLLEYCVVPCLRARSWFVKGSRHTESSDGDENLDDTGCALLCKVLVTAARGRAFSSGERCLVHADRMILNCWYR